MPLVVITDCDHGTIAPEEKVLKAAGVEYRLHQGKQAAEVMANARDADALIVQYASVTGPVLDVLSRCRAVARYGVGVDTLDIPAATERGVVISNVPDYCMEDVSDHALALALACWRRIAFYDRAIHGGVWNATAVRPVLRLAGRVMGVVGLGRIGAMTARKAAGVGMQVVGCDPYLAELPAGVRRLALDALLRESDIVSIHVPLTEETRHLIGEPALRQMKPTAFLVNTSRGGVVDTAAIERALREGWIAGAGLDVLEHEPIPAGSPLLSLPNLILTPHAAWYSENSTEDLKRKVAEAVVAVLRGKRPDSVVNPEVYERANLRAKTAML
ncbi:MAG TPA: C-terminal binding protein [Candidatus Sulfotelmatobacter sp.]|nr:C-terminal binding protein [Candidatus Sulfotelmatobacter sp.]